jgi:hypothetical protein
MIVSSILGQLSAKALLAIASGAIATGGAAAATGSLPASMQVQLSQAMSIVGVQVPSSTTLVQSSTTSGVGSKVSAAAKSGAGASAVVSSTPAAKVVSSTPAAKVLASSTSSGTGTGTQTSVTSSSSTTPTNQARILKQVYDNGHNPGFGAHRESGVGANSRPSRGAHSNSGSSSHG